MRIKRIPYKCPCCEGTGLVNHPPWIAGDQETYVTGSAGPWACSSCGGVGIIWGEERDDG